MNCPACHIPMLVVEKLAVELDCCARCSGIWFDTDELRLLLDAAGIGGAGELMESLLGSPTAVAREKDRRCPRCRQPMRKVRLDDEHGTLLDLCPHGDGIWLDHGEVGHVAELLGGPTDARGRLAAYLGMLGHAGEGEPPRDRP
jgi:Zn-finger nucleic acid-binding protein